MKRILREPLLHFLLLGAVIFAAWSLVSEPDGDQPGQIVVTQGQILSLTESFTRVWQRPPTADELAGLIQDRVREEVYMREALALGLDQDDMVIRRRLRQKMEFISDDIAAQTEPTDAELSAWLQAHPDPFRVQRQFTFSQVFLNPDKHRDNLARHAAQLLSDLNQPETKADGSALGDSFLLEHHFAAATTSEVARHFGEAFAAALGGLALGRWQGPIESGYGVHLVLVSQRTEGRLPELAEVRDAVRREWANAQRLEANEKFYQQLLARYRVTVERPQPTENDTVPAVK